MKQSDFLQSLKDSGALLEGHFLLSSGLHSPRYVQCAQFLQHPVRAEEAGRALADFAPKGARSVVSPAMGGLIIGHEVARALGVRHVFAERTEGTMSLRRGFALEPGEPVLIVEDVFTTGKSTREVIALVAAAGASAVGAVSLVDRSGGKLDLGVPHRSLLPLVIETYTPPACPLCDKGTPAVKPGSRTVQGAR